MLVLKNLSEGKNVMTDKAFENSAGDWYINPICRVIVGFRNYTNHATRSKYVSFSIENEPKMCELLLLLSCKKPSKAEIESFPDVLLYQLIDYGFLKPIDSFSLFEKFKQSFHLLNESRHKRIEFKGKKYAITSFIFMAFYSQPQGMYLRETIILPFWNKTFSRVVFDVVRSGQKKLTAKVSPKHIKRMLKHGLIARQEDLPVITTYFARECILSEKLFVDLPDHCREMLYVPKNKDNLIINPQIYLHTPNKIPTEVSGHIHDEKWVLEANPSVWVRHPVTQVLSMYWLDEKQLSQLQQLLDGEMTPSSLDEETFKLFCYIHLIDSQEYLDKERTIWREKMRTAKEHILTHTCVTIPDILATPELAISQAYIRHLYHKKYLLRDRANGATKGRYWVHRDDFTIYIHQQICTILNQFLPSPVKLGHNGITIYKPGAVLPKHNDDVLAFKWVMSLPVDTDPVRDRADAWPIYVETAKDAILSAKLRMGDGHLIDPQMPHWRDALSDHTLGILLLWFVPHDFTGYVNGNWID
jgi:hypothetical protein